MEAPDPQTQNLEDATDGLLADMLQSDMQAAPQPSPPEPKTFSSMMRALDGEAAGAPPAAEPSLDQQIAELDLQGRSAPTDDDLSFLDEAPKAPASEAEDVVSDIVPSPPLGDDDLSFLDEAPAPAAVPAEPQVVASEPPSVPELAALREQAETLSRSLALKDKELHNLRSSMGSFIQLPSDELLRLEDTIKRILFFLVDPAQRKELAELDPDQVEIAQEFERRMAIVVAKFLQRQFHDQGVLAKAEYLRQIEALQSHTGTLEVELERKAQVVAAEYQARIKELEAKLARMRADAKRILHERLDQAAVRVRELKARLAKAEAALQSGRAAIEQELRADYDQKLRHQDLLLAQMETQMRLMEQRLRRGGDGRSSISSLGMAENGGQQYLTPSHRGQRRAR